MKNKPKEDKPFDPFSKDNEVFDELEMWIWIDVFCERYGWTVKECLSLRIPTFYKLRDAIVERNKRETKRMNKK